MGLKIVQADAFSNRPFAGNPAAVCVLPEPGDPTWMQNVALEMNLPATAFLHRQPDGSFNLRWFTSVTELGLCGHGTLASVHVLCEEGYLEAGEQVRFNTGSGLLTAIRQGEWIELNLPAEVAEEISAPPSLLQVLGTAPKYVGKNRFDYLVELESEAEVRNLKPDLSLLRQEPVRGLIVTGRATSSGSSGFDFVSRFFSPALGIDEDSVTGSAHCGLGPYWQSRLGKTEFLAYQASARGGVVRVRVGDNGRVYLGGQAVTVLRGELA